MGQARRKHETAERGKLKVKANMHHGVICRMSTEVVVTDVHFPCSLYSMRLHVVQMPHKQSHRLKTTATSLTLLLAALVLVQVQPFCQQHLTSWMFPRDLWSRCPDCCWRSEERAKRSSGAVLANAEEGQRTAGREDSDAAASIEVPIHDCKKPTCIHVDEIAGRSYVLSPTLNWSAD